MKSYKLVDVGTGKVLVQCPCERCSTWEEAVEQHERMADRLRDKLKSQIKFDVFDVRGQDDALRNTDTDVGRVFPQIDLRLGNTTIDECERRFIVSSLYSEETDY